MPTGPRPRPPVRSIRLAFTGILAGDVPWANILWCHDGGSAEVTSADLTALATFAGSGWGANLISHMVSSCVLTNCHVSFYSAGTDLLEADATLALAGTNTTGVTTAQQAVGISWRIPVGYRGGHPRNYLAGVPSDKMVSARLLRADYVASIAAGANTFLNAINGYTHGGLTDMHLVCMSFVRDKAWRTPPVPINITSALVDARLDTIRNRLGPDIS